MDASGREVEERIEQGTMRGEEYKCCELSILQISLVDPSFRVLAVTKGERALQRPIVAIAAVGEVTRGEKGTA